MPKTRNLTVYLLKEGFNHTNTLIEDHDLELIETATNIPDGSVLYVLDKQANPAWWKSFFGIQKPLLQALKGALLFHPYGDRTFAFSFGHVSQKMKSNAYEYDFGITVTLNAVDPDKLKSTDTVEPGETRRQRTQLPLDSSLSAFKFDGRTTMLKGVTGKTTEEYSDVVKSVTGAHSLKVRAPIEVDGFDDLCDFLLELYTSTEYRELFPDVDNVKVVRDPDTISVLDQMLLQEVRSGSDEVELMVPDIINYFDNVYCKFRGLGKSDQYDEVLLESYHDYLSARDVEPADIELADVKKHQLTMVNENGFVSGEAYSIYNSVVMSAVSDGKSYHICEGNWYEVDGDYISEIEGFVDAFFEDCDLPAYDHDNEAHYNDSVADELDGICLDKTDISLPGQSQVEPCDVLLDFDERRDFVHVKRSTLSSGLSHLFNQGLNSYELLKKQPASLAKLKDIVASKSDDETADKVISDFELKKLRLTFAVVTHKDGGLKSQAFPLFSKITAYRTFTELKAYDVQARIILVADDS